MIQNKLFWSFVIVVGVVFLFVSCSSDDESPVAPTKKPQPPTFSLATISIPQKMIESTDTMAQLAIQLINEAQSMEQAIGLLTAPQNAEVVKAETGEWEYKWVVGALTQTLKITSTEGRYTWRMYLDGTEGGINYINWRFLDAAQQSNKSNGHVYLFKLGTQQIESEWVWNTLSNNDYQFTRECHDESCKKTDITIKLDNSGKIERYVKSSTGSSVYDLRISWDVNGNGTWWTYEDGQETGYGTW